MVRKFRNLTLSILIHYFRIFDVLVIKQNETKRTRKQEKQKRKQQ